MTGTTIPSLYEKERWNYPTLVYTLPVSLGAYTVNLKFAELYNNAAGQRVFNIDINGTTVLTNFDVFAQTGGEFKAIDKSFSVNATNGQIMITLTSVIGSPAINAIEVVPQ